MMKKGPEKMEKDGQESQEEVDGWYHGQGQKR